MENIQDELKMIAKIEKEHEEKNKPETIILSFVFIKFNNGTHSYHFANSYKELSEATKIPLKVLKCMATYKNEYTMISNKDDGFNFLWVEKYEVVKGKEDEIKKLIIDEFETSIVNDADF